MSRNEWSYNNSSNHDCTFYNTHIHTHTYTHTHTHTHIHTHIHTHTHTLSDRFARHLYCRYTRIVFTQSTGFAGNGWQFWLDSGSSSQLMLRTGGEKEGGNIITAILQTAS